MGVSVLIGLLFVLPPVVMVGGALFGGRLRSSAHGLGRAAGRVVGFVALIVAWEIGWLGLLAGAGRSGATAEQSALCVLLWLLVQPIGLWLAARVAWAHA